MFSKDSKSGTMDNKDRVPSIISASLRIVGDLVSEGDVQVDGIIDSPAHSGDFVVDILSDIHVSELLEEARRPQLINQEMTLGRVLKVVAEAHESYFPVVDNEDRMVGIFSLTDIRRIYLEEAVEDFIIAGDFMIDSVITARPDEDLDMVLQRMTINNINAIPVMDPDNEGQVLAILERNAIGRAYDRRLHALKSGELTASSLRNSHLVQ